MARPHAAMIVEDTVNRTLSSVLRRRGWRTRILPYTGYGSLASVRVLGRVLMSRSPDEPESADATAGPLELWAAERERRGWRSFVTVPAMSAPVRITLGDRVVEGRTDRSGIVDVVIGAHGLGAGWHEARIESPEAEDVTAAVLVVGSEPTLGIVSDIDDTVITTMLPRPMIAAWNTFVRHEGARKPVPGMATMYRRLLAERAGAPVVYVSTGAWNTVPQLTRFLRDKGYPLGPLLMTDWGPTNTGWFRSGQEHKRDCLRRLADELPNVRWLLVGDDGQHDPSLYQEFAEQRPDRVEAIGIRVLSATEQMLSHFTPLANDEGAPRRTEVPLCRASDGYGLLRLVRVVLGETPVPADVVQGS